LENVFARSDSHATGQTGTPRSINCALKFITPTAPAKRGRRKQDHDRMQIAALKIIHRDQQVGSNGGRNENDARAGGQMPGLGADQSRQRQAALAFEKRQRF